MQMTFSNIFSISFIDLLFNIQFIGILSNKLWGK